MRENVNKILCLHNLICLDSHDHKIESGNCWVKSKKSFSRFDMPGPGESIFCSLCSMNSGLKIFCSLLVVIHSLMFIIISPNLYSNNLILFVNNIFCLNSSKYCVPFVISYILNINSFMILLNLMMVAFHYR